MTKIVCARRGMTLVPVDDDAREAVAAVKDGRDVMVEIRPSRRPKQHRTFFGMLKLLVDNSEAFDSIEGALTAVKIACGEADPIIDASTGKTFWTLRSIAFESMDQARFSRLFDRALHVITDRWLAGIETEELRRQVFDLVDGPGAIGRRAA